MSFGRYSKKIPQGTPVQQAERSHLVERSYSQRTTSSRTTANSIAQSEPATRQQSRKERSRLAECPFTDDEVLEAVEVYEANYGITEGRDGWVELVPGTTAVNLHCELVEGVREQYESLAGAPTHAAAPAPAPAPARSSSPPAREPSPAAGPCGEFRLDMTAAQFGHCSCGFARAEHR